MSKSWWLGFLRALAGPNQFIPPVGTRELTAKMPDGSRLKLTFDGHCSEADYMQAVQWVEDMQAQQ